MKQIEAYISGEISRENEIVPILPELVTVDGNDPALVFPGDSLHSNGTSKNNSVNRVMIKKTKDVISYKYFNSMDTTTTASAKI